MTIALTTKFEEHLRQNWCSDPFSMSSSAICNFYADYRCTLGPRLWLSVAGIGNIPSKVTNRHSFILQKHLNMQGSAQKEARNSYIFLNQFKMPYYGEVTVRQYLILTALMRMSRKTKTAVKLERVDQVMSEVCVIKKKRWPKKMFKQILTKA